MNSVTPTVALVTGAAEGIGWETAQRLASEGLVVVIADLDGTTAQARAASLGTLHMGLACDVTSASQVEQAVAAVVARYGRIDVLVNNAGIADQVGPTVDQNVEAFDRVLAVHLKGTFLMSQAVARVMLKQVASGTAGRGAMVNLASIASLGGMPARNAYSAAKTGIVGMTRAMASEWARSGIRVNAVAPGYVNTALVESLQRKGAINGAAIAQRTPLGRMARPAEIAEAIAFLASSRASYITGVVLPVDGGWSAFGAPESALEAVAT